MIVVDTSVWIDMIRGTEPRLSILLDRDLVLQHQAVTGELALGTLPDRAQTLAHLRRLAAPPRASDNEALHLIERTQLHGTGIGWVDAHLIASTLLQPGARLWTKDRKLEEVARSIGIAATSAQINQS